MYTPLIFLSFLSHNSLHSMFLLLCSLISYLYPYPFSLPRSLFSKLLTRILPLFVSISALEDMVGVDYFMDGRGKSMHELPSQGTEETESGTKHEGSARYRVRATPSPADERQVSTMTKFIGRLAAQKQHDGMPRWKVFPLLGLVLTLVLAMCGRLATLEQACDGSTSSGQRQTWVGKWCYQHAYPLLTSMPGSPSECGCAAIIVSDWHNNTCDPTLLTQLHDDLVNEDRQIAKHLRVLMHLCPSQNVTQTENILAAKLDHVSSIGLFRIGDGVSYSCPPSQVPCAVGGGVTEAPPTEVLLTLPELKAPSLLTFIVIGVPLALPSSKTLAGCARLVEVQIKQTQLVALPKLDGNPKLYVTVMYPQRPQHCMLLPSP